jgi:hypothetical protein
MDRSATVVPGSARASSGSRRSDDALVIANFSSPQVYASPFRKFVAARRRNQHARRVRSPNLGYAPFCQLYA